MLSNEAEMHDFPQSQVTTRSSIVGGVLTQARNQRGLRQEDLAQAAGLTQATWSRVEKGTTKLAVTDLWKVAPVLGSKPSEILREAEWIEQTLQTNGAEIVETIDYEALKKNAAIFLTGAALMAVVVILVSKTAKQ
jgi:transcriptional regulator with XRE-family HTH domain